jgi:outer membrane protein
MMRKLLFAAAFLLPMLTVAQDAAVVQLSLQQAKAYARANSYETKGAAIDIQQADKDIWRATSLLMPQVSGSIGFNNFINLPTSVVEADAFFPDIPGLPLPPPDPNAPPQELQFGMPWSSTAGINASQVLFNGSYIIGLKGAKGLRQLQASKGRMVEHEVMAATEESYITALVAAENAKMLKANVDNMKKTLRETSALFETGFLEQIDVSQVELLLLNLESQIALAER